MPTVTMNAIPYAKMRYSTAGDWRWRDIDMLEITVARMPDPRYETLIATHELVEAVLCRQDGISEQAVDAWDKAHLDADEPGEIPGAPYFKQHAAASEIERLLAAKLGVDWKKYSKAIADLPGTIL